MLELEMHSRISVQLSDDGSMVEGQGGICELTS
jgi:hypothetical protein